MNKEDLIKKYEGLEGVWNANGAEIARQCFLRDLEQLNEIDTERVTVHQYIADWYEKNKDDFEGNLFRCINSIPSLFEEGELSEFEEWLVGGKTEPFQTLVNMHQFGYTVEKEKKYKVKGKGLLENYNYLNHFIQDNSWLFNNSERTHSHKVAFTRKELEEAGFGWVFDCPGIEIEEVE